MKLKDYLPLYLGCEVEYTISGMKHNLIGVEGEATAYIFGGTGGRHVVHTSHIKPILRLLSDMTEEEFMEFKKLADKDFDKMVLIDSASKDGCFTRLCHTMFAQSFLLSKHFDLFGLIEAGLAIDKTTLNKPK
jgi:hypothetical protein